MNENWPIDYEPPRKAKKPNFGENTWEKDEIDVNAERFLFGTTILTTM